MPDITIAQVRQQYPQYNDMSDTQLASALHAKFYSDMPQAEFNQKIGFGSTQSGSSAQPTATQQWLASPGGRLLRSDVVDPLIGLMGGADKVAAGIGTLGLSSLTGIPALIDKATSQAQGIVDRPFDQANAAARNTPGYAKARATEDQTTALNPAGFAQSLLPETNAAVRGLVTYPFGGADAANAAMDSQAASQGAYAKANPAAARVASVAGGLLLAPNTGAVTKAASTIPSIADLNADAARNYAISDASTMGIKGSALQDVATDIRAQMMRRGFDPELHPAANRALARLQDAASSDKSMQEMDTLGRVANNAINTALGAGNDSDAMLAGMVKKNVNKFINDLPNNPQAINGALDQPAIDALQNARASYAKASKADIIQSAIDKAKFNAQSLKAAPLTASGDQLRTQFRQLANSSLMDEFNPAEQDAIRKVATGDTTEKILRLVGKLSPDHVLPAMASASAAAVGGPHMLAIPAVGLGAKLGANALTARAAQAASDLVRSGGAIAPAAGAPFALPSISAGARYPLPLLLAGQRTLAPNR